MTTEYAARLTVSGTELAVSADAVHNGAPALIDGLTFQWGRDSRVAQPDPGSLTATLLVPSDRARDTLAMLTPGAEVVAYTSYKASERSGNLVKFYDFGTLLLPKTINEGDSLTAAPAPLQLVLNTSDQWTGFSRYDGPDFVSYLSYTVSRVYAPASSALAVRPVYYATPRDPAPVFGPWTTVPTTVGTHTVGIGPATARAALDPAHIGAFVGWELKVIRAGSALFSTIIEPFSRHTEPFSQTGGITISEMSVNTSASTVTELCIFSGRVASAPITWDEKARTARITLSCNEWTTDLKNRKVGSELWPSESAFQRINRIHKLCGITYSIGTGVLLDTLAAPRDIDSRPALDLIHEYATAIGAVAWPCRNDSFGEYFILEAEDSRINFLKVIYDRTGRASITVNNNAWQPTSIDAAALRRSGVSVDRDVSALASAVRVSAKQTIPPAVDGPAVDDPHAWEDYDVFIADPGRERDFGAHEIHITAGIAARTDRTTGLLGTRKTPEDLARAVLARCAPGQWKIQGLTLDSRAPAATTETLTNLLSIAKRPGHAIILRNMPEWMPGAPSIPVYLEGASSTLTGQHWEIALTITHGGSQFSAITFKQCDAHIFSDYQDLTFSDLATAQA